MLSIFVLRLDVCSITYLTAEKPGCLFNQSIGNLHYMTKYEKIRLSHVHIKFGYFLGLEF